MLLEPHIYLTLIYSYASLSIPSLYPTLLYPTLPYSALLHPTLPHPTLLYLTLLYPTLPSDPTPTSQKTPHNPKVAPGEITGKNGKALTHIDMSAFCMGGPPDRWRQ